MFRPGWGDELSIHGDPPGLRLLAERASGLAAKAEGGAESVDQLSTKVRIVARPAAGKRRP